MANPYETPSSDPTRPDTGEIDTSSPFSPKGRFTRLSYIAWYVLINIISYAVIFAVGGASLFTMSDPEAAANFIGSIGGIVYFVMVIVSMVLVIIFTIRRAHDLNKSGWLVLIILIPFAFLYFLLGKGDEGANRFAGFRPTKPWETVLGYIGIGLMVLALVGIVVALFGGAMMQM